MSFEAPGSPQTLHPIVESLVPIIEGRREADPATHADFDGLSQTFDTVIARFAYSSLHRNARAVSQAHPLRQEGPDAEDDDAPRMWLRTDPFGELESSNFRGEPTLALTISDPRYKAFGQGRNKIPGVWSLSLKFAKRAERGVGTIVSGGQFDGKRDSLLFGEHVMSILPATKGMIDWASGQIGDPDTLVVARTKKERRAAWWAARLGWE